MRKTIGLREIRKLSPGEKIWDTKVQGFQHGVRSVLVFPTSCTIEQERVVHGGIRLVGTDHLGRQTPRAVKRNGCSVR